MRRRLASPAPRRCRPRCKSRPQLMPPTLARGGAPGMTGVMPTGPLTGRIITTGRPITGPILMRCRCRSSSASALGRGGNICALGAGDKSLVAIPYAFEQRRTFVRRQKPPAEFPEHIEEPRLITIVGGAIGDFELHDGIDGHRSLSAPVCEHISP